MPAWLEDAVFYEIYPQSFYDSNADGIGDIKGITQKLDYILSLGCNAVWLNPCFDSPFKDAGYDVRDYRKVAPRYGTNEDLYELFEKAHEKGIRVLLDLVPGHTSEEHEWFRRSSMQEKNEFTNRYVWTDFCFSGMDGYRYVAGESQRSGTYLVNFFKCQPALNYGFGRIDQPWQLPPEHPDCRASVAAIKEICRFWLDHGCDGFRVDMAGSLVKNDDDAKTATSRIYHEIREMFDRDYPAAALVAEWSEPELSIPAGFHCDFLLNDPRTPYSTLVRDYGNHAGYAVYGGSGFNGDGKPMPPLEDHSFFKKDAGGDVRPFIDYYLRTMKTIGDRGYISMITGNHDTVRLSYSLDKKEQELFYAFLFTMPGVPFLYYGDEIGMRYLNLPTREGGYFRTGARTPMQWESGKNLGFSDADPGELYLPEDGAEDAPTVESQENDENSMLSVTRRLIALRHADKDLHAQANLEILHAVRKDPLLVCRRGKTILAFNTSGAERAYNLKNAAAFAMLDAIGGAFTRKDELILPPQSFAALKEE